MYERGPSSSDIGRGTYTGRGQDTRHAEERQSVGLTCRKAGGRGEIHGRLERELDWGFDYCQHFT
jgi:hypothetical protein